MDTTPEEVPVMNRVRRVDVSLSVIRLSCLIMEVRL